MSWKSEALRKAEVISDAWEVVKAYAGRIAEWVLFLCMIANIVEMLPGVSLPMLFTNIVLGVQVVMLDIGGMSMGTMAAHIRDQGNIEAADKASLTSKFLIGLMIVTLLVVSIGVLFPDVKVYMDMIEKGLILIRVVMTVIYGHVIHSLRSSGQQAVPVPQPAVPAATELEDLIKKILVPMFEQYRSEVKTELADQMKQVSIPAINYQRLAAAIQSSYASGTHMQELNPQPLAAEPIPINAPRQLRQLPRPAQDSDQEDRDTRLLTAYRELLAEHIKPTGTTLSSRAHCNRAATLAWLKQYGINDKSEETEAVNMEKQA